MLYLPTLGSPDYNSHQSLPLTIQGMMGVVVHNHLSSPRFITMMWIVGDI